MMAEGTKKKSASNSNDYAQSQFAMKVIVTLAKRHTWGREENRENRPLRVAN